MLNNFDFLAEILPYSEDEFSLIRLNARHRLIVEPFLPQIKNSKVLDLACHDGRWSYALASAGAKQVIGVEARQELVERFALFPDAPFKNRISLRCNDLFDALEDMVREGEQFDIVALFGIFYHIMDHFRLLRLVTKLNAQVIVIDSEFIGGDNAIVQLLREETSNTLNAIRSTNGVARTVVGVPSRRATEFMADALAHDLCWIDHNLILEPGMRKGMKDYFRDGRKVRGTCALTPKSAQ